MNLSKNQKRLAAVLGVCIVALVSDQLFMSPDAVEAAPERTTPKTAPPGRASAAPDTAPGPAHRAQHVARWGARDIQRRLVAATRPAHASHLASLDIFYPAPPATPTLSSSTDRATADLAARAASAVTEPDPAADFRSRYELRAVIASGQHRPGSSASGTVPASPSIALVNDRMLRLGEGIGGFRLIAIERDAVTFELAPTGPDASSGPLPRVRLTISDRPKSQENLDPLLR